MDIKLVGVSIAELESALRYSGLYVQADDAGEYAEIKAIPQMIRSQDIDLLEEIKGWIVNSRNFEIPSQQLGCGAKSDAEGK